ncbi:hypothetical protein E4U40_002475 [Claviceps sp. LM458 group G5]|nr:hypothetical protein E4U40_002475 [Claviceps sp. LM458 group G5]
MRPQALDLPCAKRPAPSAQFKPPSHLPRGGASSRPVTSCSKWLRTSKFTSLTSSTSRASSSPPKKTSLRPSSSFCHPPQSLSDSRGQQASTPAPFTMFDLFAMLLSSIASFLFPIFASYKALKTSDPAQLTPWLMYWVVFSICLLVESWFSFILFWVPFYGYIRLLFFLYLILPQTQGARVLYEDKVHPFLRDNEYAIDEFIASAHHRLKNAGLTYFRRAVDYIKTNLLNFPPTEQRSASAVESASSAPQGYTQSLLARFSVPTARWSGAAGTGMGNDFYSLLANAVSATTSAGAGGPGAAASSSSVVPPHLRGSAEKMDFITAQRERLNIVLNALDREAQQMQADGSSRSSSNNNTPGDGDEPSQRPPSGMSMFSGLSKSRSETDFEKVEAESGAEDEVTLRRRQASSHKGGVGAGVGVGAGAGQGTGSSWMPWGWSTTGAEGDGGVYASRKQD